MFNIKKSYISRGTPQYLNDEEDSKYQVDVYNLAIEMARRGSCIIDIGCGKAGKLRKAMAMNIPIIGLDYGANIEYCQATFPYEQWISADFENADIATKLFPYRIHNTIMICSDVIEHLIDPTNLLLAIKEWTRTANYCIISTPDRDLYYGTEHNGPPPNPAHIREWNLLELEGYLKGLGFDIIYIGLTRAHINDKDMKTIIAVVK